MGTAESCTGGMVAAASMMTSPITSIAHRSSPSSWASRTRRVRRPWALSAAPEVAALGHAGFAGCFNSLAWWDLQGEWLAEESRWLADCAPVLATLEAPFGPRLAASAPLAD